jgi:hypothetical protein
MSTQTLAEAARLLATLLVDTVQVYDVGDPITVGFEVTRSMTPVGQPVPGLVQSTTLQNAVESKTQTTFAVKVAQGTQLVPGQAVKVLTCVQEPQLVGKVLLLDKISLNGAAGIRKAVASDFETVNQEGKEGLA